MYAPHTTSQVVCNRLKFVSSLQESFSLWDSKKWIKGVTKGDSILFMYRLNVRYSSCCIQEYNILSIYSTIG